MEKDKAAPSRKPFVTTELKESAVQVFESGDAALSQEPSTALPVDIKNEEYRKTLERATSPAPSQEYITGGYKQLGDFSPLKVKAAPSQESVAVDTDLQILYRRLRNPSTPTIYSQDVKAMNDAAAQIESLTKRLYECDTTRLALIAHRDELWDAREEGQGQIAKLEAENAELRQALVHYDFWTDVPQQAVNAIDAVLSGAPPSEISDDRIFAMIKADFGLPDVGMQKKLYAFARAVLKEGK